MAENKQLNLIINDGAEFYAHESSINFNPMQVTFDFKSITPRIDQRSQESQTIVMRHNVIMIDPFHAKQFHQMLGEVLSRFEKEFGKIEKPDTIKKFEKKAKSATEKAQPKREQGYFG